MTYRPDRFSWSFLDVQQLRSSTSAFCLPKVDLIIVFSSFEVRCLEITRVPKLAGEIGLVFQFKPPGMDNGRTEHAESLFERLRSGIADVKKYHLDRSVEISIVQPEIMEKVLNAVRKMGRAVSVLIDISTCPKHYFLPIIGWGFSAGAFSRAFVFYAETDYKGKELSSIDEAGFRFTEGDWEATSVPYLEGHFRPGRPRHTIVSMGGDGRSVEKLIRRYEPDKITLISPIPSVELRIEREARKETELVRASFGVTTIIENPAFDVVGMCHKLVDIWETHQTDEDIALFCLGTKPQALAMGLIGLINEKLQVVCRVPARYTERAHAGNGYSWVFSITDNTNPAAPQSEVSVHR